MQLIREKSEAIPNLDVQTKKVTVETFMGTEWIFPNKVVTVKL